MKECLRLAKKGLGKVSPNPMVGCVIVYNEKIIGTGYHKSFGKNHAEVNAIKSVKDKSLLKKSTQSLRDELEKVIKNYEKKIQK